MTGPVNDQFRQQTEMYVRSALDVIARWPVPLPMMPDMETTFNRTTGSVHSHGILVPDYRLHVARAEPALLPLLQQTGLLATIQADDTLRTALLSDASGNPLPIGNVPTWLQTQHLTPFLTEFFQRHEDTSFDAATVADVFSLWEQFAFRYESIVVHWLIQLQHFAMTMDTVKLESDIRLRRATDTEIAAAAASSFPI